MTGPEHYQEAERLLAIVDDGDVGDTMLPQADLIAMASVHATLALAAAMRESTPGPCTESIGPVLEGGLPIRCALRTGHSGGHESDSGTQWWTEESR